MNSAPLFEVELPENDLLFPVWYETVRNGNYVIVNKKCNICDEKKPCLTTPCCSNNESVKFLCGECIYQLVVSDSKAPVEMHYYKTCPFCRAGWYLDSEFISKSKNPVVSDTLHSSDYSLFSNDQHADHGPCREFFPVIFEEDKEDAPTSPTCSSPTPSPTSPSYVPTSPRWEEATPYRNCDSPVSTPPPSPQREERSSNHDPMTPIRNVSNRKRRVEIDTPPRPRAVPRVSELSPLPRPFARELPTSLFGNIRVEQSRSDSIGVARPPRYAFGEFPRRVNEDPDRNAYHYSRRYMGPSEYKEVFYIDDYAETTEYKHEPRPFNHQNIKFRYRDFLEIDTETLRCFVESLTRVVDVYSETPYQMRMERTRRSHIRKFITYIQLNMGLAQTNDQKRHLIEQVGKLYLNVGEFIHSVSDSTPGTDCEADTVMKLVVIPSFCLC